MSILQIVLISIYFIFAQSTLPFGSMGTWATIDRPLVAGLVVGLILGNPVQGTIIGASINIIYLGIISAGGSIPSDSGMAGIFGTALALAGGLETSTALALSVPLGLLGSVENTVVMTLQCFLVKVIDKWIDEGKSKMVFVGDYVIPYAFKYVIRFIMSFVILYYGSSAINSVATSLDGPYLNALNVMGGMIPAVGLGLMLIAIFKGKARWFFFLGFLGASYLGLGAIPTALIFGIIAILIANFQPEDFEAFKNTQDTNEHQFKLIDKKTLVKSWVRWEIFCETLYNYERMQGIGFCTGMIPCLEKIYKDDKEGLIAAMKRHAMFFNTDHNFGGMILGICVSMEEQKKLGEDIPEEAFVSLKSGLMGPCAGVGDTLSQVVLIPILIIIFINLALQGATWAPIAYTVIFLLIFYGIGYWMLFVGYKNGGETVFKIMESGILDKVIDVANILGCAVTGALLCNYVSFSWNVVMVQNEVEIFNLQTGVFDAILPNAMPLLLTLGVYAAVKKGVKASYVTFGMMIIGFLLGLTGLVA